MSNVRAVERAMSILLCFDRQTPTLSLADLQERLGLSRATLYRLLQTLESTGLIDASDAPARYCLRHTVLQLADAWQAQLDVTRLAEPVLTELWMRTDETVTLYVPVSDSARVAVRELRSRQPLSFSRGVGYTDPTTSGASGHVMLAYLSDERTENVLRELPDSARRETLRTKLATVREQGYSCTVGERITGAVAIATPVFDHTGAVVAAISLFGPEARLQGDLRRRYIQSIVEAGKRLSHSLGAPRDETETANSKIS